MERDSFIMRKKYNTQLQMLSTTQKAQRVDAVFERQATWKIMENLDPLVAMLLSLMIQEWLKDNEKYDQVCEQNRINWMKWWAKKWNQNARKNWEKQPKQANGWKNNPKQPKQAEYDNDSEYDSDITLRGNASDEVDEKEKELMIQERENQLRQTWRVMKAERLGILILKKWNEKLNKDELRNSEYMRYFYSLESDNWSQETVLDMIDKYLDRFKWIRDKINEKDLQPLFFFNLNNRTFNDFMKHLNKFEGKFEEIIPRFTKQDTTTRALRELKS